MVVFTIKGDAMTYENFKKIVPENVQKKIYALAESIDFYDLIGGHHESMAEQQMSHIEGNYCSGWMPLQDGGFSVDQFYQSDINTPTFTQKQKDFISDQYNYMLECFMSDNGIEEIDYEDEALMNRLYEYENEWWQPALLQFQVFVERLDRFDDHSPMQVVCRLSINYTDAPYYREKHAEDIKQVIYTIDEFMQLENNTIIEVFRI